jgi:hypothetical protein
MAESAPEQNAGNADALEALRQTDPTTWQTLMETFGLPADTVVLKTTTPEITLGQVD